MGGWVGGWVNRVEEETEGERTQGLGGAVWVGVGGWVGGWVGGVPEETLA